ncbi:MAG: RNHCP domain-containing protein [Chloroflexi bacterium]|nr:RNHCP domain-containing protein [Chloroflexota bacterium]
MKTPFVTQRIYTRPGKINNTSGDFVCLHCEAFVSVEEALSGVRNRNHCPYCLSSRHLDQFEAGDRLSACKAPMRPVGLTIKQIAKKYAGHRQGELMLVHLCQDCGKVSINRIAADDAAEMILSVLEQSAKLDPTTRDLLARNGVVLLSAAQIDLVRQYLFGINYSLSQEG